MLSAASNTGAVLTSEDSVVWHPSPGAEKLPLSQVPPLLDRGASLGTMLSILLQQS